MRSNILVAVAACLAFSAGGAFADPASPTDATQAPATTSQAAPTAPPASAPVATTPAAATAQVLDPNEIICVQEAPTTGTRLGARRICQSRRDWDQQHHQAEENIERYQAQSRPPGG